MIDLKGLFPAVTALIAFVITLCCLFAGTQKNVLDSVNLLTVRPFTHLPSNLPPPTSLQYIYIDTDTPAKAYNSHNPN